MLFRSKRFKQREVSYWTNRQWNSWFRVFFCGIAFSAYFLHKRILNKEVQRRRRLELILQDLDQQTLNKNVVQMIQNVQRNMYFPLDLVLQQPLVDLDSDGPLYQDVPENGRV